MNREDIWPLLKDSFVECRENKVERLAAALAYYAMFSLAPLLILVVIATGLAYGQEMAEKEVNTQLATFVGQKLAEAVLELTQSIRTPFSDLGTTIIGIIGIVIGGSALFHHLKDSLNTIWEVTPRPGRGLRNFLMARLLAICMLLNLGIIALLGLSLSIGIEGAREMLSHVLPGDLPWYAARAAQLLLAGCIVALLVALTYKVLPDTHTSWRDVWVGASLTALLLVVSQVLVGLYLRTYLGSAYSMVGAVVVVLIWAYYASLVFFFGAAFTRLYANRHGSRIVPAPHAVSLSAGDRAAQGILRTSEIAATETTREREVGSDEQ
jgi:membrane protein